MVLDDTIWVKCTLERSPSDIDGLAATGVYATEVAAAFACNSGDDFIALVEVGKPFPPFAVDAIKMYYPFLETWETSVLYKMRERLHTQPSTAHKPQLKLINCEHD